MSWIKNKVVIIPSEATKDTILSAQQLYVTSNEEVKYNNWCLHKNPFYAIDKGHIEKPIFCTLNNTFSIQEHWRKIIATTDCELGYGDNVGAFYHLPQLSQQFIEKLIERYNKCHNQIIDVLVEYETVNYCTFENGNMMSTKEIPKVNPDNTINIKLIDRIYTFEEVVELLKQFNKDTQKHNSLNDAVDYYLLGVDKWIEEHQLY